MNVQQVTDLVYLTLFNMDQAALRIKFGLPPARDMNDDLERDFMGIEALRLLMNIENDLTVAIRDNFRPPTKSEVLAVIHQHGNPAKADAQARGIDLLTGKSI